MPATDGGRHGSWLAPPRATEPPAPSDQGFGREHRIRRRPEFLRCYRSGRRRGGRFATLFVAPSAEVRPRLGVTASRKVGKAVVRQRLKRRVREIFRRWERRAELPAVDLVVNLKPSAAQAAFAELRDELVRQMTGVIPGERGSAREGRDPEAARGSRSDGSGAGRSLDGAAR